VLGSALVRRVEVPLALGGGESYQKAGVMPHWPRPIGEAECPPRGGIRRVCGRHGMEDQCVTPGGRTWFLGGDRISDPIS
jgi:hypothetical protein